RDVRGRYPAVAALRKPFDLTELLALVRDRATRNAAPHPPDAAQTFMRHSVTSGAKAGVVVRRRGDALELVTSFGYPPGEAETYFPLAVDAQLPLCAAARHGRAVWLSTLQSSAADEYP